VGATFLINEPFVIVDDDFQRVWLRVVRKLIDSRWDLRNLIVQVRDPLSFDPEFGRQYDDFSRDHGLLGPRHVAYTIFPHRLYRDGVDAHGVFDAYNRQNGLYERLHRRKHEWGTYFRRMTHYEGKDGAVVNQLGNIIGAFNGRANVSRAAFTIVIQYPGGETVKPLGAPCLNYLAVQADPDPFRVGLLAVYRNHDFLKRAYGNYWGLCNLLSFIAKEVGAEPGPLTCVSSHAYVAAKKRELRKFVGGM
jgi:hypothetical protein